MNLLIFSLFCIFISSKCSLEEVYSKLEDKRKNDPTGRLNVFVFGYESAKALEIIIPRERTMKDQKRAFFEFCKSFGHENRTAVISLSNKIMYAYEKLPVKLQLIGKETLTKLEREELLFDEKSLQYTINNVLAALNEMNIFRLMDLQEELNKMLPHFRKIFYNPINRSKVDEDLYKEEIVNQILNMVEYVLGPGTTDPKSETKKEEL